MRSALIVASYEYQDPRLRRLRAPGQDAEAPARVLKDPAIGGFAVRTMLNEPAHVINEAVEEFFSDRTHDDLLLMHFSGHGIKNDDGALHFAAANTKLHRLSATAVAAEFVNREMNRSRSRRIVLLLDCCYAGAFARGLTARAGMGVGVQEQLGGRGRAVITASSALEYAFEGDELADAGDPQPSVFTSALVEGLATGDADRDLDGLVGLDELYDYVYDKVRDVTPNQTPGKWTFGLEGELYVAYRSRPVTTPVALPPELQEVMDHPIASIRAGAVQELERMLQSRNAGRALAANFALQRLADDDSRTVAAAATAALQAQDGPTTAQPAQAVETAPPPIDKDRSAESEPARSAGAPSPPPTNDQTRPSLDRTRRHVPTSGLLAIAGAALIIVQLFLPYRSDTVWAVWDPAIAWAVLQFGVVGIAAGALTIWPPTARTLGPGLLLGIAPISAWWLMVLAAEWRDANGQGQGLNRGFWLVIVGHVAVVVAAWLAAIALKRSGAVQLRRPASDGAVVWTVVLLGIVGALAGLVSVLQSVEDPLIVTIWVPILAAVMPLCATAAAPSVFGSWLLTGWSLSGLALYAYVWASLGTRPTDAPSVALGVTLVALLPAAWFLGRTRSRTDMDGTEATHA